MILDALFLFGWFRFLDAVLPKEDLLLRQMVNLRPTYDIEIDECLPYDLEYALSRIFEEEFKNWIQVQNIREEIMQTDDFALSRAFRCMDSSSKDFLTVGE